VLKKRPFIKAKDKQLKTNANPNTKIKIKTKIKTKTKTKQDNRHQHQGVRGEEAKHALKSNQPTQPVRSFGVEKTRQLHKRKTKNRNSFTDKGIFCIP
jgi:hypothetical protein